MKGINGHVLNPRNCFRLTKLRSAEAFHSFRFFAIFMFAELSEL